MLSILYEDDDLVAVSKPAGMLVHRSNIDPTATDFALQTLRDQIGQKIYLAHRLDRKTSGVLLFGKSPEMVRLLQQQWQSISFQKEYLALVRGYFPSYLDLSYRLANEKGTLQSARTIFRCLEQTEVGWSSERYATSRYSIVQAFIKTGRMHQIRKHCNHLRHPIIGDRPHGCNKQNALFLEKLKLEKMLLHAHRLVLKHPISKEHIEIKASLPTHFKAVLNELQFKTSFK